MNVAYLSTDSETFEMYVIEGDVDLGLHNDQGFNNAVSLYRRELGRAKEYLTKYPDQKGDIYGARKTYQELHIGGITHSEWVRIFAQAWYATHNVPPRIEDQDDRIVLPFEDITLNEQGRVGISYGHKQRLYGFWHGSAHPMWQSINTIPGNIGFVQRIRDEKGEAGYKLGLMVVHALADSPDEFVLWAKYGMDKDRFVIPQRKD
jgi:hypothetical protein